MTKLAELVRDRIGAGGPQLPEDEYENRIDRILWDMPGGELLDLISEALGELPLHVPPLPHPDDPY